MVKKKDIKKINHVEKDFVKIFKLFLKTKYVWGGKTVMELIVQLYSRCITIIIIYFIQEIQKTKSNIQEKNLKEKYLKKVI